MLGWMSNRVPSGLMKSVMLGWCGRVPSGLTESANLTSSVPVAALDSEYSAKRHLTWRPQSCDVNGQQFTATEGTHIANCK